MKRHHKISRFIFALTALFTLAVKAENLSTSLIEVVSPTPLLSLGIPLNQVPSNVQIGSAKEISQQGSLNLSDFLDSNLGSINTSGSVGNPYQNDVSYRGFNASPILGNPIGLSVYVDGVRFNEPFGDIVNWDLIPMNAISAINLMPGSNPLFGLNTLGGSLSVNTKNGIDFPGLKASLTGGSWGRRAFEFETGGVEKNIDYFVAGNIFHEDGWRDHSSSDVRQLFSKVRWHGEKSNLDLSVALADNEMEGTQALPMSMMSVPEKPYTYPDSIKNQMVMINLKGDHLISETKLLAGNVYYRRNQMKSFNSNAQFDDNCLTGGGSFATCHATNGTDSVGGIDAQNVSSKTIQNGYGGSIQLTLLDDVLSHKNQATVGASADLSSIRFNQNGYGASLINFETVTKDPLDLQTQVVLKAKTYYYGIYGTNNYALNEQVNMTLSGRYNVAFIDMNGSNSDFTTDTISSLDGNHRYSRFNPAVGLNYNPSSQLGFYGGYNEGMRAPTPIELACANKDIPCSLPTGFNSDPDLKKVVSKTWEGGVRGKLSDKIRWNASVYQSDMTNDIQFITANVSGRGYFDNVGDTRRRGVELGAQAKLERLTLLVNYGLVDATYQSSFTMNSVANSAANAGEITVNKGNHMPGIARQTLKLRGMYDLTPSWNLGTNVILATGQFAQGDQNNKDSNGKIPGYAVVNLDSRYSVTNQWSIFAKVNNLFDKDYSTFGTLGQNIYSSDPNEQFRTPSAPRAGWLGITYSFGGPNKQGSADKD
jgi:iron complex outermembrane recepter protein